MPKSKIEWTDFSWNPITGCTPISAGCKNCYAKRMARRLAGRHGYPEYPNQFDVTLHEDKLWQPLKWKKPRRIFVCSMSDLFHEDVPIAWLEPIFQAIRGTPYHTYQILTKRPERMVFAWHSLCQTFNGGEPLPNVWLGVTAENQEQADRRIPILLSIPAAVRFVSVEPMLSEIDLRNIVLRSFPGGNDDMLDALNGMAWLKHTCLKDPHRPQPGGGLSWVILGAETGPGARPIHPGWVRSIRDQCVEAGVPFFFKGWGEWRIGEVAVKRENHACIDGDLFFRIGRKLTGNLIDGKEWHQFPEVKE